VAVGRLDQGAEGRRGQQRALRDRGGQDARGLRERLPDGVEIVRLDAICIWCVGSAICMTILAVLAVVRVLSAPPPALRP
jgi:hypothetical protein